MGQEGRTVMVAIPRARIGPNVHALLEGTWADRRAFILGRPYRCRTCRLNVPAGETVIPTPNDLGYVCTGCAPHHVRGAAACELCVRLLMQGPKCRACGGAGYGERRA